MYNSSRYPNLVVTRNNATSQNIVRKFWARNLKDILKWAHYYKVHLEDCIGLLASYFKVENFKMQYIKVEYKTVGNVGIKCIQ